MLVIKIGGGAGIGADVYTRFAKDIATLNEPAVIVHGGNAEFSQLCEALGIPVRKITSKSGRVSRYTDAETMDAMLMAYCGKVNKHAVADFRAEGVNAVGLSAIDGGIAFGRRKAQIRGTDIDGKMKVLRDDHAGTIDEFDPTVIQTLMDAGYVVLVSPPGLSEAGVPINFDGDKLALGLAQGMSASGLLFFSDTPGLLRDRHDESTLVPEIDASDAEGALGAAEGRMVVKVEQAIKAVEHGVGQVIFADARIENPVSAALAGQGTVVQAGSRV